MDYKEGLVEDFWQYAEKKFAEGEFSTTIDCALPLRRAGLGHEHMQVNRNIGKIVLAV